MNSPYRYYEAGDGRRLCYARDATFRCPNATETVTPAIQSAAAVLGADPDKLRRVLYQPHRHGATRERVDGRLTDRCAHCGAKLERLGFRVWVERPATAEEIAASGSLKMSHRLGMGATVTDRSSWCETKREAREWALDGYRQAQAALAEGVA